MIKVPTSRAEYPIPPGHDGELATLRQTCGLESEPKPSEVTTIPDESGIAAPMTHRCREFFRRHPAAIVEDRDVRSVVRREMHFDVTGTSRKTIVDQVGKGASNEYPIARMDSRRSAADGGGGRSPGPRTAAQLG